MIAVTLDTGLRYLITIRHKPMLSAGNRPMIEHALNILIDAGINGTRLFVTHGTCYVCPALKTVVLWYTLACYTRLDPF
jgi:dTDP-glucose pyrophosphorylase